MNMVSRLTRMIAYFLIVCSLVAFGRPNPSSGAVSPGNTAQTLRKYLTADVFNPGAGVSPIRLPRRENTIEISAPGELSKPDTEYVLKGDIAADGTAFTIVADDVTLNLNGHTIIYDNKSLSSDPKSVYGIYVPRFGQRDIVIANGKIRQGAGNGSGNVVGWGHNPIFCEGTESLEIGGLDIEYAGKDIVGIFIHWGKDAHIHHNAINDRGTEITNRHQGLDAIRLEGANAKIHHNLVKRCRHRAFTIAGHTEVYNNDIYIDSHATNSYGVMCFDISDFAVHHNRILGQGEHPVGVGAVAKAINGKIYENYIEVQNTRASAEYGSTGSACIRLLWGSDNIEVYDNTLIIHAKNDYQPGFHSWGRAVWVGLPNPAMKAKFTNNTIIANNDDGKAKAVGIAITDDNEPNPASTRTKNNLVFAGNTVVSNWSNVLLSDSYGQASGYSRFIDNIFIRDGSYPTYTTVRSQFKYWPSTAIFISNRYENGAAADSIDLEFSGSGLKDAGFGWHLAVKVVDKNGQPLKGADVNIIDARPATVFTGTTDASGVVHADVIAYFITNEESDGDSEKLVMTKFGEKGLKVLQTPHKILVSYGGSKKEQLIPVNENKDLQFVF